jgi:hypothetical protein
MAEQRRPDADLEQALGGLGEYIAYPPTPDLSNAVRLRLQARPTRPVRPIPAWQTWLAPRRLALAALVVLAVLGALLAASPEARRVIADRLGIRGIEIQQVPVLPTLPPTPTPEPATTPVPAGVRLRLGTAVPLEEARQRADFRVYTPSLPELGAPDEVYIGYVPAGGRVSFVYYPRPGLLETTEPGVGALLIQFRGEVEQGLMGKRLGPGTSLESLTVNGGPAFWITGEPHAFMYIDPRGDFREETLRMAGNVLIWEQDGVTLRLEGVTIREDALRIAQSMR